MPKFTEKQQNFVNLVAAGGMTNQQCAIAAGYATNSAHVQAAQLMGRADVKAALKLARKSIGKPAEEPVDDNSPKLKDKYADPMALMEDVMNNPKVAFGIRWQTAKDLMPYFHGKVGDEGKKDKAKARAKELTGEGKEGKRPRFAPGVAPKLVSVK